MTDQDDDPARGPLIEPVALPEPATDRRGFYRQFAGELVRAAATVVGTIESVRDISAESARAFVAADAESDPAAPDAFAESLRSGRSPRGSIAAYRFDGERLAVVDQRTLPGELTERTAVDAHDVAALISDGAAATGLVAHQVAAFGVAMTARTAAAASGVERRDRLGLAISDLRDACRSGASFDRVLEPVLRAASAAGGLEDGSAIAAAMLDAAISLVRELAQDEERLAGAAVGEMPRPTDRPLRLLVHGGHGPLSTGLRGAGLELLASLASGVPALEVMVLEGRPARQGARLTAWELGQIGVPTTVVVDAAAAPLLTAGGVAAVLLRADSLAANGDVRAPIGTLATAIAAARANVPVIVLATTTAVDPAVADGSGYEFSEGAIDDSEGRSDGPWAEAHGSPESILMDVTPIELIDAIVTEEGILRRPFDPAIRAALGRHAGRRWKEANPTDDDLGG